MAARLEEDERALGERQVVPRHPPRRIVVAVALTGLVVVAIVVGVLLGMNGSTPTSHRAAPVSCNGAQTTLVQLLDHYPSGLAINQEGAAKLKVDLQALDASCGPASAQAFRANTLTPWLNRPETAR